MRRGDGPRWASGRDTALPKTAASSPDAQGHRRGRGWPLRARARPRQRVKPRIYTVQPRVTRIPNGFLSGDGTEADSVCVLRDGAKMLPNTCQILLAVIKN